MANHRRARFDFDKMRRFGFDDPKDATLLDAEKNGGEDRKNDIYVELVGAGDSLQLTKTEVNEHYPVFSPDGRHVAFQTDRTGTFQIWTADADGKKLRQITDTPFPSTSPNYSKSEKR